MWSWKRSPVFKAKDSSNRTPIRIPRRFRPRWKPAQSDRNPLRHRDTRASELAKALGSDKTTLMSQLDRLERARLLVRLSDPGDRRARIPQITNVGEDVRAEVARECSETEQKPLDRFSHNEIGLFGRMLFEIIGDSQDPAHACEKDWLVLAPGTLPRRRRPPATRGAGLPLSDRPYS